MLPQPFIDMLCDIGLGSLPATLAESAPDVSVRVNPSKGGEALWSDARPVPWCPQGRVLDTRPAFTLDPRLHQGRYYVQEAASMYVGHVLRSLIDTPVTMLDACAAPGGKSTAAYDALPRGSVVVSAEYVPARADILAENITKWGMADALVLRTDTRLWRRLPATFDVILADVPCSGEGMMRKEPQAVAQWSAALVDECAARQRDILANLWPALRPGGILIYSTCTFNRRENEEQLLALIADTGAESLHIPHPAAWGIQGAIGAPGLHAARFVPGVTLGEGLFMAALRKPGNAHTAAPSRAKLLSALSRQREATLLYPGTIRGERPDGPQHADAMAAAPDSTTPRCDVDAETALQYLRRQAVALPDGTPRGYVLLTYDGYPLGYAKNLGSRANNLYPRNWRIRNL